MNQKIVLRIAKCLLYYTTLVVVITSIFFICGISISYWNAIIPFILLAGYMLLIERDQENTMLVITISVIIMIILILLSSNVYEFSVDGNAYHKQAIGLLKDGWNPIYFVSENYNSLTHSSQLADHGPLFWAEVYPKATWYFAAVIYYITGNIEAGKCYTLLFTVITFGVCFDFFYNKYKRNSGAIVLALLIAVNPVVCAQHQSYYLDGVVAGVLAMLIIQFVEQINVEKLENKGLLACLLVWGCNLKFSVVLFVVTYCAIFLIYRMFYYKKIEIYTVGYFLACGLGSVFVVGCAPYLTNFKRYGNMFYGFFGLIDEEQMAKEFGVSSLSRTGRFLASIFGKMSSGNITELKQLLKIPFTVYPKELDMYYVTDTRVGGFGIFFSGLFVVAVAIIIIKLIKERKNLKNMIRSQLGFAIILFGVSFLEMMFIPQTSQVRYVPQLYLVVALAVGVLYEDWNAKISKLLAGTLCVIACFNISPWIVISMERINDGAITTATLKSMGMESEQGRVFDVSYCNDTYNGLDYNMKDFGIKYNYNFNATIDDTYNYTYSYMIRFK